MITRTELQECVREWGLREDTVEKDYAISWLLWGIGRQPAFRRWAFKGGTCLKKCYIETYRFSEDLDFTVLAGGPCSPEEILPILRDALEEIKQESGLDVLARDPIVQMRPGGASLKGRIYYRGPRNAPQDCSVKLDITIAELVVRPAVLRDVIHPYRDAPHPTARIRCYDFDELFAEKIRAMGQRSRPRDLYDIVNLFRRTDLHAQPATVREVLVEKCAFKQMSVPTATNILTKENRVALEAEWADMLEHQLQALPPLDRFLDELPNLFDWLSGEAAPSALPAIASWDNVTAWAAPPTISTWGFSVPIETIRFAAANQLCIRLGYQNKTRLIEPYSLRRSRDGHYLLMSIRTDDRKFHSYRIDRIQSVEVTTVPFNPTHPIEFGATGQVFAPNLERTSTRRLASRAYTVECLTCARRFARKRRNTAIRPHQDSHGNRCSGRRGRIVHAY